MMKHTILVLPNYIGIHSVNCWHSSNSCVCSTEIFLTTTTEIHVHVFAFEFVHRVSGSLPYDVLCSMAIQTYGVQPDYMIV